MPNEAIEAIAKLLEKTPTQLADDIFSLAVLIEAQGNKGYELSDLANLAKREDFAAQVQTYFLMDKLHADCYAGILFYAAGGGSHGRRRRYEAEGWMVRKNPHWKTTWLTLYGDTNSAHVADIQRAEQERIAAEEAERQRKLLRPVEDSPGVKFEALTTLQVGHRYAVACILCLQAERRWQDRRWEKPLPPEDEPKKRGSIEVERYDSMDWYMFCVWDDQAHLMRRELEHRATNLQDTLADELVRKGIRYFYTRSAVQRMQESDLTPDFTNGYLGQPFDDAQPPINRLRDYDVMRQFVALLDPDDTLGGKFEGDDLDVILGILRAQIKRLKPKQE